MTRDAVIVTGTAAGVVTFFLLGVWWVVRRGRNAILTSVALLAFALLSSGAAAQQTGKRFAHLAVEAWDSKTCVLITYSEHNHAHLFFRCALIEEQRGNVIAPRGLHAPAVPITSEAGKPGRVATIVVGWKDGDGPVYPKALPFRLWRTTLYLAKEPEGKCPAGNFHGFKKPQTKS